MEGNGQIRTNKIEKLYLMKKKCHFISEGGGGEVVANFS